jgi:hypothetical protein
MLNSINFVYFVLHYFYSVNIKKDILNMYFCLAVKLLLRLANMI